MPMAQQHATTNHHGKALKDKNKTITKQPRTISDQCMLWLMRSEQKGQTRVAWFESKRFPEKPFVNKSFPFNCWPQAGQVCFIALTNKVSGWPKVSPLERMVRFDIHVQPTPQSFVFVRHHDHFHLALHCEVREWWNCYFSFAILLGWIIFLGTLFLSLQEGLLCIFRWRRLWKILCI